MPISPFLAVVLLLPFAGMASADTLVLMDGDDLEQQTPVIDKYISLFRDSTHSLEIEQIVTADFFVGKEPFPDAFDSRYVYWFKIIITNRSSKPKNFLLFANEWENSFWMVSAGILEFHGKKGVIYSKVHDDFYTGQNNDCKLKVHLKPGETKTLYIRTDGIMGKVQFHDDRFYLKDLDAFLEVASKDLLLISLCMGMVIFLLLTNSILGFVHKTMSSVYYFFFVVSISLFYGGYYKFFWKINPAINFDNSIMMPLISLFYYLFVCEYLDFKTQNKRAWIFVNVLAIFIATSAGSMIALHHFSIIDYYRILPVVNAACLLPSLLLIYFILRTKGRLKYYVLSGLLFWVTGSCITVFSLHTAEVRDSYQFAMAGSVAEMSCFLVGLAYKMNRIRVFAEKVKNRLILQSPIEAAKTEALKKVYKELKSDRPVNSKDLLKEIKDILRLDEGWIGFRILFQEINPDFFERLLSITPELTEYDLRFAALVHLNLDTNQICDLLHIGKRGVQQARYRLKQKLKLSKKTDLTLFLRKL